MNCGKWQTEHAVVEVIPVRVVTACEDTSEEEPGILVRPGWPGLPMLEGTPAERSVDGVPILVTTQGRYIQVPVPSRGVVATIIAEPAQAQSVFEPLVIESLPLAKAGVRCGDHPPWNSGNSVTVEPVLPEGLGPREVANVADVTEVRITNTGPRAITVGEPVLVGLNPRGTIAIPPGTVEDTEYRLAAGASEIIPVVASSARPCGSERLDEIVLPGRTDAMITVSSVDASGGVTSEPFVVGWP